VDDLSLNCSNKDWDMKPPIGLPVSILFNCFWQQASIPLEKMHMLRSANSQPPSLNISFSSNWKCEECGYLGFLCQFLSKKLIISNFNSTDVIDTSLDCKKTSVYINCWKPQSPKNALWPNPNHLQVSFEIVVRFSQLWPLMQLEKHFPIFVDPYNLQLYQSSFTPCVTHFTKCTNSNAYAQNI
jgi:hypothetical protein